MAYTKRNFKKEQLLKADDLNAMDEQIAKNADDAGNALSIARNARDDAGNALSIARNARDDAGNVLSIAGNARDDAGNALSIAGNARDDAGNALSIARNARDVADDARTVAGNANMTAINAKASADSAMARGEEAIRLAASAENLAKNVENEFRGAVTGKRYLTPTDRLDDIKDAGIYVWLSGEAPEGTPTNRSGVLVVFQFGLGIAQVVYEIIDVKQSGMDINQFFRTSFNGAEAEWSKWWQDRTPEIVFTTGYRSDAVMSQEAVTGQLNLINQRVDGLSREPGEGDTVIGGVDPNVVRVFDSMLTNGVFVAEDANALKPTAIGGMSVETAPGTVMIEGLSRRDAKRTRIYKTSDTQIVEVFLYRLDKTTGEISYLFRDCIVHGGLIFSKEDGTDLPIRESGYYDILIWKITIPAGATEITQDMIEDLRENESYCGYVRSSVSGGSDGVKVDTTLTVSGAAADAAAVGTVISNLRKETRTRDIITEKRITNLEAGLPAERWSVDDSVAYVKDVPENALPFASVDMVGGMTRKCRNLFDVEGWLTEINCAYQKTGEKYTLSDSIGSSFYAVANKPYVFATDDTDIYISGTLSGLLTENNPRFKIFKKDGTYEEKRPPCTANGCSICIAYSTTASAGSGFVFDSVMLNKGTEPLPYEPYFDGLRSAPVTEVESVGVNLIDKAEIKIVELQDGTEIVGGNYVTGAIKTTPNTMYWISSNCYEDYGEIACYDADGKYIKRLFGSPFTTPANCYSVKLEFFPSVELENAWFMLNRGTTALPYTPYREPVSLPIPAAVQALDGFGWGINADCYNYVDWERKRFVKRVERVDMGTLNWRLNEGALGRTYRGVVSNMRFDFSVANRLNGFVCSAYNPSSVNSTARMDNKSIMRVNDLLTSAEAFVRDDDYTDAATFKAAMSGVMLYYELAEPVITDISDLLTDDNLIRVVGGGMVTPVNKHRYAVPSEITYQLKGAEA